MNTRTRLGILASTTLLACWLTAASSATNQAAPTGQPTRDKDRGTVQPLLTQDLPDIPGKEVIMLAVTYLPAGASLPHRHDADVFVYVLEGEVDAWIDGSIHAMRPGDFAAFPAGTGICHCFINNSEHDVLLLVGGEASKSDNRIYYPLHPQRRNDLPASEWWEDVPKRRLGPHDGMPDALRRRSAQRVSGVRAKQ